MTSPSTDTDADAAGSALFDSALARLLEQSPYALARFSDGSAHADVFLEHAASARYDRLTGLAGSTRIALERTSRLGAALNVVRGDEAFYELFDPRNASALQEAADAARSFIRAEGDVPDLNVASEQTSPESWSDVRARAILEEASDVVRVVSGVTSCGLSLDRLVRRRFVAAASGRASLDTWVTTRLIANVRSDAPGTPATIRSVIDFEDDDPAFDARRLQADLTSELSSLHDARPIAPSTATVILAAGWTGTWVHEIIGHMLEADVFFDGPFGGRLGEMIGPTFLTVIDGLDGGDDDEAVPTRSTTLVEGGRIVGLLADQRSAHRHRIPPTGNGFRASAANAPLPRMTVLQLQPDEGTLDDLMHASGNALVIAGFRSARVTPRGIVTIEGCHGYRLEGGRRTHGVRDLELRASVRDWLLNVRHVGSDPAADSGRGLCVKSGQPHVVRTVAPTTVVGRIDVRQGSAVRQ